MQYCLAISKHESHFSYAFNSWSTLASKPFNTHKYDTYTYDVHVPYIHMIISCMTASWVCSQCVDLRRMNLMPAGYVHDLIIIVIVVVVIIIIITIIIIIIIIIITIYYYYYYYYIECVHRSGTIHSGFAAAEWAGDGDRVPSPHAASSSQQTCLAQVHCITLLSSCIQLYTSCSMLTPCVWLNPVGKPVWQFANYRSLAILWRNVRAVYVLCVADFGCVHWLVKLP